MLSTSRKISIAKVLSNSIRFCRKSIGRPTRVVVTRRRIAWALDLNEGIDFSIYLLGGFEIRTLQAYTRIIKPGDVVLDIGANIGAHTLPFAELVGSNGKVISFEPTAYAFAKQKINISLNPSLSHRIEPHQMMLVADDDQPLPESIYSSWPLENAKDLHQRHHGRLKETTGATRFTLDLFIRRSDLKRINFIKLDVDGNEYDVLAGARHSISEHRPRIMLELAPYVFDESPQKFDQILEQLWSLGYKISAISGGRLLPQSPNEVRKLIPQGGCLNVLAYTENPSSE